MFNRRVAATHTRTQRAHPTPGSSLRTARSIHNSRSLQNILNIMWWSIIKRENMRIDKTNKK